MFGISSTRWVQVEDNEVVRVTSPEEVVALLPHEVADHQDVREAQSIGLVVRAARRHGVRVLLLPRTVQY